MKDLCMHITDIVQNSIRAKANSILIMIKESIAEDIVTINIKDNGFGMSEEVVKRVTDPFFTSRTTRRVGLGISLLKYKCEMTEGSFTINSTVNEGSEIIAKMRYSHIDRPIFGNLAKTIILLVSSNPEIDFIYNHKTDSGEYTFDTKEIKETLEGVCINNLSIIKHLSDLIKNNIVDINVGN